MGMGLECGLGSACCHIILHSDASIYSPETLHERAW